MLLHPTSLNYFVTVSSRFSISLATIVHAASSGAGIEASLFFSPTCNQIVRGLGIGRVVLFHLRQRVFQERQPCCGGGSCDSRISLIRLMRCSGCFPPS